MGTTLIAAPSSLPAGAAEPEASTNDVMTPTRLGLRLTPAMARGLGKYYVADEIDTVLDLTPEQKVRLSDAIARRMMELAHAHGETLRDASEGGLALLIETDGRFSSETAQAFAERARSVLPAAREFLQGVAEDARPILEPEQFEQLQAKLRREGKELDLFENKMKRWAAGGAKDKEDLDHFEPEDGPHPEPEPNDPSRGKVQHARNWARWRLKRFGPPEWKKYVVGAKHFFGFDEKQSAEADRVLASYCARAEAIMTPEWRGRVIRNRILDNLHQYLDDVPTAPWRFHLGREYAKLTEPIEDLDKKLRQEVSALATNEQRAAAMARLRTMAAKHGMIVEESDTGLLGLEPK